MLRGRALSGIRRSTPRGATALVIVGPEQPPHLVPYLVRKLALLLLPAGVGLVKAASHLALTGVSRQPRRLLTDLP